MSKTVSLTEALRVTSEPRINGLTDDPFAPLGVAAMVHRVADTAAEKASHPWAFLMRSLVGGAMVAFGVVLSLVVSTGVTTAGVAAARKAQPARLTSSIEYRKILTQLSWTRIPHGHFVFDHTTSLLRINPGGGRAPYSSRS